jgi:hypothetical protein
VVGREFHPVQADYPDRVDGEWSVRSGWTAL